MMGKSRLLFLVILLTMDLELAEYLETKNGSACGLFG